MHRLLLLAIFGNYSVRPGLRVSVQQRHIVQASHGDHWLVCRAVFDFLHRQIQVNLLLRPTESFDMACAGQNDFSGQPILGIHNGVVNFPIGVIKEKVFNITNFAIGRVHVVPGYG